MALLANLVGVFITGFGLFVTILPEKAKVLMGFWREGNRAYWGGIIRIAIAVVVFLAAPSGWTPGPAVALGILFLVSGVLVFAIGLEKMKEQILWWENQPQLVLRLLGLVVLSFGILVLTAV